MVFFQKMPNSSQCGYNYKGWYWRKNYHVDVNEIRTMLKKFEQNAGKAFPSVARIIPFLIEPDVGLCYPNCEKIL